MVSPDGPLPPRTRGTHLTVTRDTHLTVTRDTHLTMTHDTHCHPGHPHPDLPVKHT